jgi:exodeoxyribonuclease VII large subunit
VSPRGVLARGYAIVTGPDGGIVRDAARLASGDAVAVALAKGGFEARVTVTDPDPDKPRSDTGTD